jgi:hypothetical protein
MQPLLNIDLTQNSQMIMNIPFSLFRMHLTYDPGSFYIVFYRYTLWLSCFMCHLLEKHPFDTVIPSIVQQAHGTGHAV